MPPSDPLLGRRLSNYRIERLLGRGGMASVYYGVDLHLNRPAAIKVIDDRYQHSPAFAERFVREARAMASWRHPNLPQIYQAGVEQGVSFYAMEYVQGADLGRLVEIYSQRGELLPHEDVVRIGRAVSDALDYAHGRGAVHRDVKPSNVLVAQDGRILLTDFGLIMQVDKETRGEVFGSPHYIAPEQARNSARAVPQSDLYALGVILYELLVGRLPFEDPSPASLALKHIGDPPPPPRQLNPNLSQAVEDVLLKALRKSPQERYQTGRELIDALEPALQAETADDLAAHPAAVPPATLPGLSQDSAGTQPGTISHLHLADLVAGELTAQPPTQAVPDPASGAVPAPPQRLLLPGRSWMAGCAALLVLGVLVLACAGAIASRWLPWNQGQTPLARASVTPSLTAHPPLQTATAVAAAANSGSGQATTTPEPTPTAPPTTAPAPVSAPVEEILLLLAAQKDDSLFVVNRGEFDLPLAFLQLGSGEGQILGEEWGIDLLRPGQCVTVWKMEGKPEPPKEVTCDVVGERLERSRSEKIWDADFEVFFNEVSVGGCKKRAKDCELRFVLPMD